MKGTNDLIGLWVDSVIVPVHLSAACNTFVTHPCHYLCVYTSRLCLVISNEPALAALFSLHSALSGLLEVTSFKKGVFPSYWHKVLALMGFLLLCKAESVLCKRLYSENWAEDKNGSDNQWGGPWRYGKNKACRGLTVQMLKVLQVLLGVAQHYRRLVQCMYEHSGEVCSRSHRRVWDGVGLYLGISSELLLVAETQRGSWTEECGTLLCFCD